MPALSPQEFISRDYASDLSAADLLRAYRLMVLSRKLDERCWILHRQGKIAFHISGIGQEACQLAAGLALQPGKDTYFPHYRDMVTVLALGMRPVDILMGTYGKAGDPGSGGRQMPNHYNYRPANIVSVSSPVTTQVPQCAGVAFAIKLRGEDSVAMCALGEGATSQGDWHEGLNWAGIHKLPFICLVENNSYAISVPMDMQMPVMSGIEATIAIRAGSGPNRETCILAMTANASPDDHKACLDAGMDGFESKPVRKQKLHAMLAALGDGKQTLVGDKGQMPGMLPVLQDRDRAA